MSRIIRCAQQSDLWIAARRGRITGSRLGDMMAPPTTRVSYRSGVKCEAGTEALAKAEYRHELIVERITGQAVNHFNSRAMQEGMEREPFARMLYEADTQQVVDLVGFALHYEWDWFGSSADGLCGEDGGVELKCPTEMVHDSYSLDPSAMVDEYKWQVLGNLTCFPERQWWDLVSFNPHFPDSLKLVKVRFPRSEWTETIRQIEDTATVFNWEIATAIARRGLPPTVWDIMPQEEAAPEEWHDTGDFAHDCTFIQDDVAP
jgi:hypothetical protein